MADGPYFIRQLEAGHPSPPWAPKLTGAYPEFQTCTACAASIVVVDPPPPPDVTAVCVTYVQGPNPTREITLLGSLDGGSFTGASNFDGSQDGVTISLEWDATAGTWIVTAAWSWTTRTGETVAGGVVRDNPVGTESYHPGDLSAPFDESWTVVVGSLGACQLPPVDPVCECLSDPLFHYGSDAHAIGRTWRTEASLYGPVASTGGDSWQHVISGLGAQDGSITFETCGVQVIELALNISGESPSDNYVLALSINGGIAEEQTYGPGLVFINLTVADPCVNEVVISLYDIGGRTVDTDIVADMVVASVT